MIYIGLGLLLILGVVIFCIRKHSSPPTGSRLPALPGDLVQARLDRAAYFGHDKLWHEGDFLEYLESLRELPPGVYNSVIVHGDEDKTVSYRGDVRNYTQSGE